MESKEVSNKRKRSAGGKVAKPSKSVRAKVKSKKAILLDKLKTKNKKLKKLIKLKKKQINANASESSKETLGYAGFEDDEDSAAEYTTQDVRETRAINADTPQRQQGQAPYLHQVPQSPQTQQYIPGQWPIWGLGSDIPATGSFQTGPTFNPMTGQYPPTQTTTHQHNLQFPQYHMAPPSAPQRPMDSSPNNWAMPNISSGYYAPLPQTRGVQQSGPRGTSHPHARSPKATQLFNNFGQFVNAAHTNNTNDLYARSWRRLVQFGQSINIPIWPLHPAHLAMFIAHLAEEHYAPSSIRTFISAISYVHKVNGQHDPAAHFTIQQGLKGLAKQVPQATRREPLTVNTLNILIQSLYKLILTEEEVRVFRVMFVVAFFSLLRIGEMTGYGDHNLLINSVQELSSKCLVLRFTSYKHSKEAVRVRINPLPSNIF
ncbi:unnamed protein product, partial [Owenia fusiformis]